MGSKTRRNKTAGQDLKAKKRKELFMALLPLFESFGLWIILVIFVAWDYTNHRWFSMFFIDFTTYLSVGLSKILFIPAAIFNKGSSMVTTLEVNYQSIQISNYPMIIELECSAYHAYLALISLVIFSKWSKSQKIFTGSLLFVLLAIINSIRIILLGIIGRKFPNLFNLMHDYIWNILLVIIIWGLWELSNQRITLKNEKIPSN